MNILATIGISLVTLLVGVLGAYNYLPLGVLDSLSIRGGSSNLGATITNIAGTDTLSSSRAVINTNFDALNTNKFDISSTSHSSITTASALATVGTIITGIWNGTLIDTLYGGTGSTTLSEFSVLLGSTTNSIGLVNGLGSSGQFLTSNGVSNPPSWQSASVNQTSEYDWTGDNTFTASTTFNTATEAASSFFGKLFFAGAGTTTLDFSSTPANTASSSVISTDSNGAVSWVPLSRLLYSTTVNTQVTSSASTSLLSITIPANTFGDNGVLHGNFGYTFVRSGGFGAFNVDINLTYGGDWLASTTFAIFGGSLPLAMPLEGSIEFSVISGGISAQEGFFDSPTLRSLDANQLFMEKLNHNTAVNSAADQTLTLTATLAGDASSFTLQNGYIELIR